MRLFPDTTTFLKAFRFSRHFPDFPTYHKIPDFFPISRPGGDPVAAGTRFVVPPDMSAARRPSLTSLSNSCKASQSVMIHVANVPSAIGARKFGIFFLRS